jgi:8-oxo-dGTP diphosphatase
MDKIQEAILQEFGHKLRLRVCGICIEAGQILAVKHQYLGEGGYLWAPPGGGLQYGESVESCLKREFIEETGLDIAVERFLFVNEFLKVPLHGIELFFEVRRIGGSLKVGQDPEMLPEQQMIEAVAFLSAATLQAEKPDCLHAVLRQQPEGILAMQGYYRL